MGTVPRAICRPNLDEFMVSWLALTEGARDALPGPETAIAFVCVFRSASAATPAEFGSGRRNGRYHRTKGWMQCANAAPAVPIQTGK